MRDPVNVADIAKNATPTHTGRGDLAPESTGDLARSGSGPVDIPLFQILFIRGEIRVIRVPSLLFSSRHPICSDFPGFPQPGLAGA